MSPLRVFLIGLLTALGVGVASGVSAFRYGLTELDKVRADLPEIAPPGTWQPPQKTRLYAADGTLLTEIYRENRELLPLRQIPRDLLNATVAAEDRRFYDHIGVSPRDIGRAILINLETGRHAQGASTITQQLVRDLYLSRRKQLKRKLAEALLAVELERQYSKEEILELYLNQVNYGKGLYGVRTAAHAYFGKSPGALTLGECAALAAIPQRPADNNLYADPAGGRTRRDRVLDRMVEQGYITAAERDRARRERLVVKPWRPPDWRPREAPYYTTWAVRELFERLGEERVYAGGLEVVTELDRNLQRTTDAAVARAVAVARGRGAETGAGVLLENRTGAIKALCGGLSWDQSQFNRATQARRQPGSAFKVFVYSAALDRGFRPTDTLVDEPFSLKLSGTETWRPQNYDHRFRGTVTLTEALAQSINIPAIKLLQRLGPRTVISYAQRMGVRSELRPVPSLALGTSEVTLLELVSAYSVLPNQGRRLEPTTLREIRETSGRVIYRRRDEGVAVLSPKTAYAMVGMMQEVMRTGTGRPAALDIPCAGKTGTTQNGRDAWFVGYSPRYSAGVWLGSDRNRRMRNVFGGTDCGPAWRTILRAAARTGGIGTFEPPTWVAAPDPRESRPADAAVEVTTEETARIATICPVSGLLATPACPDPAERQFEPGLAPTSACPLHTPLPAGGGTGQTAVTGTGAASTAGTGGAGDGHTGAADGDTPPADADTATPPPAPVARPGAPEPTLAPAPDPTPDNHLTVRVRLCRQSGMIAKPGCHDTVIVDYAPGDAPTVECALH